MWFTFALYLNMLISLRNRFIAVFSVGLFIIIAYKLIEYKQYRDAGENTEQNSNSSDNSLIFVHSVSFREIVQLKLSFFKFLECGSLMTLWYDTLIVQSWFWLEMIFCVFVYAQICRHGNRNIVQAYPNDPYKDREKYWIEGFGQLTNVKKLSSLSVTK